LAESLDDFRNLSQMYFLAVTYVVHKDRLNEIAFFLSRKR